MSKRMYKGSPSAKSISKIPQRKSAARRDEYGKSEKGLTVCPNCHNFLYKKEWHHPMSRSLEQVKLGKHGTHFKLCPACWMAREHLFEGEIIIENVPTKYDTELVRLITSQNASAQKRDPQDRILSFEKQKEGYRVTTTENEFAQKLAKKIKKVFNKVEYHISYAAEPAEVARVTVRFL